MNNNAKIIGSCVLIASGVIASSIGRLARYSNDGYIIISFIGAYLLVEGWTGTSVLNHIKNRFRQLKQDVKEARKDHTNIQHDSNHSNQIESQHNETK